MTTGMRFVPPTKIPFGSLSYPYDVIRNVKVFVQKGLGNMDVVKSKNGVPIRLTEERWLHITEEHSEMAGYYFEVLETIEEPDEIFEGRAGEYISVREIEAGKYIVVIYREVSKEDGFVITAFITRRKKQLERRRRLWKR